MLLLLSLPFVSECSDVEIAIASTDSTISSIPSVAIVPCCCHVSTSATTSSAMPLKPAMPNPGISASIISSPIPSTKQTMMGRFVMMKSITSRTSFRVN